MFWILINHKLENQDRFTDEDMFKKYGVKYQLYIEWQTFLMSQIEALRAKTAKVANSEDTFVILMKEFWDINMAKFFYIVDRDQKIIDQYAHLFFNEMMQILWEEWVSIPE